MQKESCFNRLSSLVAHKLIYVRIMHNNMKEEFCTYGIGRCRTYGQLVTLSLTLT